MIAIKDTTAIIHLAKLSLLEKSCGYFQKVVIPELVYEELLKGKEKGFPDVPIVIKLIKDKKISVKKIKDIILIKNANQFNVQRGEAESVALYWQEKADVIVTDDDNVRKKKVLLNINVIGTPAVILRLFREKIIDKPKIEQCISELRKIGWFSNLVLDNMLMEVKNGRSDRHKVRRRLFEKN